jgi:hypothetical protein
MLYKHAYRIWFFLKSLCCALHDKDYWEVAVCINNIIFEWLRKYYTEILYTKKSHESNFLAGLLDTLFKQFQENFNISPPNTFGATSASVTQQRCHTAADNMFSLFKSYMESSATDGMPKLKFPENVCLYSKPYPTYKAEIDQLVSAASEEFDDGSILKLLQTLHIPIQIDDATPFRQFSNTQVGVNMKHDIARIDGAQQASNDGQKIFTFPYLRFELIPGTPTFRVIQHTSILDTRNNKYVWFETETNAKYQTSGIRNLTFGPIVVLVDNPSIRPNIGARGISQTNKDSIIDKIKRREFMKSDSLLSESPRVYFCMPYRLLLNFCLYDSAFLDRRIADMERKVCQDESDPEFKIKFNLDGEDMVFTERFIKGISQNDSVYIGKLVIPGVRLLC